MENTDLGKSTTGMQPNVAALLCYVLGWVTGLIFYLIEKENKFVRFHAFQSMVVFGGVTILSIVLTITVVGIALLPIIYIAELVLWVVLMVKAYQGDKWKLPIAGDMAEKNS
jgi:uncharacterized membrane protein